MPKTKTKVSQKERYDAIVVGSGPNGLAAAAVLAGAGARVLVIEAADRIGGGLRTEELTLPGYQHDVCSAAHPTGILSPFFQTLPLEEHGLKWLEPPASIAHPLDGKAAVIHYPSLEKTAAGLGVDGRTYTKMLRPFLGNPQGLLDDALGPLGIPSHPVMFTRFGLLGIRPATNIARRFREESARALFAGCAAHSILPLSSLLTGALGVMFSLTGHVKAWPVAAGGSESIARALTGYLKQQGVEFATGWKVTSLGELPPCRAVLFDTDPRQLADIADDALPGRYRRRLRKYRYGPGVFKVDYALDGPIPWKDENCLLASTVHIGGTIEEIAAAEKEMWQGGHPERPFVMLVQQSQFDKSRAPAGKHTGYAYCHVPHGSTVDMTDAIENQIERFAPGFKKLILKRHKMTTAAFHKYNPNYFGGAITGGVADLPQAFLRPVARLNPYTTPNKHLFICSASTPPGGGVHGMCGFHAARSVLKRLDKLDYIQNKQTS
jgi:phytoene dehydrogenase-like protein